MRTRISLWLAALFITSALGLVPAAVAQDETPPVLKASDILPRKDLTGPGYRVEETVYNDGYLNTYMLRSRFGDQSVTSTALLYTRIAELAALEKMAQVSSSKEFGGSLADKGKQTVMGAVNLVTDPIDTVGGALSGVGKVFVRAHESLVESNPSKYEDSRFAGVTGYSATKRDYAKQFGVDPYSTSPVLQKGLDDLTGAGYAGKLTGTALQALIPGGVGVVVSGVSSTALFGDIDLSVPPTDLRKQNRETLAKMDVPAPLARLFINNETFTPTQQTVITRSLAAMPRVKDRAELVELAADTSNQDVAFFRQRMIQMYAAYNEKVGRLDRFVQLGRFVGAMKEQGGLLLAFPLDYLALTKTNQDLMDRLNALATDMGVKNVELRLTGKASPLTKKHVKKLGWKLAEASSSQLLGTWY